MSASEGGGRILNGRFRLESQLGSGGGSIVWRATDLESGRIIAIKILKLERRSRNMRRRFALESELLQKVAHANIAKAISADEDEGDPYIALELVEGPTLRKVIVDRAQSGAHFTGAELRAILSALCAGIGHAHAHEVVHRDLKPQNVVITSLEGGACGLKVLDFGLAKLLAEDDASEGTTRGRRVGSLLYMAPEQARGEVIDHRIDVFALAVIAFEMITLRQPWFRDPNGFPPAFDELDKPGAKNEAALVLQRILYEPRPRAGFFRSGVRESLDAAIDRALSIDPGMRTESIAAFVDEVLGGLDTIVDSEPTERLPLLRFGSADRTQSDVAGVVTPVSDDSFTWVRPRTVVRPSDEPSSDLIQIPSIDDMAAPNSVATRPRTIPFGVAVVLPVAAALVACLGTVWWLGIERVAPRSEPVMIPSAPIVNALPVPSVEQQAIEEEAPPPPLEKEKRAPSRKRLAPAPRPAQAAIEDPRLRELATLDRELRAEPGDAAVARIARRVAAIAQTLPSIEKRSSIVRRAMAASMAFEKPEVEACLAELSAELR